MQSQGVTGNAVKIRDGRAAVIVSPVKTGFQDNIHCSLSGKASEAKTTVRKPALD
jgi:hypothetical protein